MRMNADSLIEKMGDLTDAYIHALSFGTDAEAEEIIEELAVVQKEYRRSLNDSFRINDMKFEYHSPNIVPFQSMCWMRVILYMTGLSHQVRRRSNASSIRY